MRRNVIPRRFVRLRDETVMSFREPDRMVGGAVVPGRTIRDVALAGTGWLWLGRVWRFKRL